METLLESYKHYREILLERISTQIDNASKKNIKQNSTSDSLFPEMRDRLKEFRRVSLEDVKNIDGLLHDSIFQSGDGCWDYVVVQLSDPDLMEKYVNLWRYYEKLLAEPMWPMDYCHEDEESGQVTLTYNGLKLLKKVILSVLGVSSYLADYGDWCYNEPERGEIHDPEGRYEYYWQYYLYWKDILDNYSSENRWVFNASNMNESNPNQISKTDISNLKDYSLIPDKITPEEFHSEMMSFLDKHSDWFMEYKNISDFPTWDEEYDICSISDYQIKFGSNLKSYKYLDRGLYSEPRDTVCAVVFEITTPQFHLQSNKKHYENQMIFGDYFCLTVSIMVGEQTRTLGSQGQVFRRNIHFHNGLEFDDKLAYSAREHGEPLTYKFLYGVFAVVESYIKAFESLSDECFDTLLDVYAKFRGPSLSGDACCLEDELKLEKHFRKYGFFEYLEQNLSKKFNQKITF